MLVSHRSPKRVGHISSMLRHVPVIQMIKLHWGIVINQFLGIYIVIVRIPILGWTDVIHVPCFDQHFRDLNLTLENL